MSGTTVAQLTPQQFARRILATFPADWAGTDAAQSGIFGDLLLAIGTGLSEMQQAIVYTAQAARLTTETNPELDLASVDFFGLGVLPRPAGMVDSNYAQLIIQNLFQLAATRPAIAQALFNLTGVEPRMLEPFNIFDTGVWDSTSYWDVDTLANPARWGGLLPYQGFIETPAPPIPAIGPNNPILCWDDGAYWDTPGYFFGEITLQSTKAVFDLVSRLRACGTQIWIKITNAQPTAVIAPGPATNLTPAAASPTSVSLSWTAPTVGTTPVTFQVQWRITGTIPFSAGPTTQTGVTFTTVTGLAPFTTYDLRIITSNSAGSSVSSIVTVATLKQPPSPATNLQAAQVQATAVTLTWSAPTTGTLPFNYAVNYRVTGTVPFTSFSAGQSTAVTVINLQPATEYDFEVVTSNQ